ncbi:MAG: sulfate adenylyltransferase [Alcaligenaceae bacterium]|jgi:sulfate adenylyltransferase subunit 1|nr:sulfate adenylyltransferase [Alcaligenaceae bacterium]
MSTNSLLRFITAGSVDDGKSTLIGRLLYDSHSLMSDQVEHLEQSQDGNSNGLDFAQLTDGLAAEREQGITIDVAYRYFSTPKRKFILADAPGHEQYTRNMVTGASTADAAIILIDATRLDLSHDEVELLRQSKRHSALLKLLAIPNIIVAINKLDLLDYDEKAFNKISSAYKKFASQINLEVTPHFIPISALHGENIVKPSDKTPWYSGPALLPLLESLPSRQQNTVNAKSQEALGLFPVQRVVRQDGSAVDSFRGYQGRLVAGTLRVGQEVRIEPNGQRSRIKEIFDPKGAQSEAHHGQVLTITLDDEIDISRGDTIVAAENDIQSSRDISAHLAWIDERPLNPKRRYWLKHGHQSVYAKIKTLNYRLNIDSLSHEEQIEHLAMNDIALAQLSLQQAITATPYADNHLSGAFILIDEASNNTVAAGMINQLLDQ